MRLFILCVSILVFATLGLAQLPILKINGSIPVMSATFNTNVSSFLIAQDYFATLTSGMRNAGSGRVAYISFGRQAGLLEKNKNGTLESFAVYNVPSDDEAYGAYSNIDANDEWMVITYFVYFQASTEFTALRINENRTLSVVQRQNFTSTFEFTRFMPDGSLLAMRSYNTFISASAAMYRFQFTNNQWTLVDTFTFKEPIRFGKINNAAQFITLRVIKAIFQMNSTHLLVPDASHIYIYERETNGTFAWNLRTTIGITIDWVMTDLNWNGVDTIVMSNRETLYTFVKDDSNTWNALSTTKIVDLGVPQDLSITPLGYSIYCFDVDTFLLSIPEPAVDGTVPTQYLGAAAVLQRRQGTWTFTGLIQGASLQNWFGGTILAMDSNFLFDGHDTLQTAPMCVVEPMRYDCMDKVSMDCNFEEFDARFVCTTNQTECNDLLTTDVIKFGLKEGILQVDYQMNRFGAESLTKSVTITCVSDSSNPSTVNSPSGASPLSVPRGSGNVTSDAGKPVYFTFGFSTWIVAVLVLFN